jgi:hypothetical protein
MATFIVQIAETNNFELPIEAETEEQARKLAMEEWLSAPTTGQWEIADMNTEIVAVTRRSA